MTTFIFCGVLFHESRHVTVDTGMFFQLAQPAFCCASKSLRRTDSSNEVEPNTKHFKRLYSQNIQNRMHVVGDDLLPSLVPTRKVDQSGLARLLATRIGRSQGREEFQNMAKRRKPHATTRSPETLSNLVTLHPPTDRFCGTRVETY